MTNGAYRGVVRGGTIVLHEGEAPLIEGTEVLVTPAAGPPGSPAAVLAAVEASPRVPAAWVDELEQLIAQGQRPPAHPDSGDPSRGSISASRTSPQRGRRQ
jgi:hypothetical protein